MKAMKVKNSLSTNSKNLVTSVKVSNSRTTEQKSIQHGKVSTRHNNEQKQKLVQQAKAKNLYQTT